MRMRDEADPTGPIGDFPLTGAGLTLDRPRKNDERKV